MDRLASLGLIVDVAARDLASQVFLHRFVHNSVMLDQRSNRIVLGFVMAPSHWAFVRCHIGQFFGKFSLEVSLAQMPVEVALVLAGAVAIQALNSKRSLSARFWGLDVFISRRNIS